MSDTEEAARLEKKEPKSPTWLTPTYLLPPRLKTHCPQSGFYSDCMEAEVYRGALSSRPQYQATQGSPGAG